MAVGYGEEARDVGNDLGRRKEKENGVFPNSKKTMKVILGFVLNRNREASLEDSTPIEGFLSVWGFNGELRRFMVDTGGCGLWRRSSGRWK